MKYILDLFFVKIELSPKRKQRTLQGVPTFGGQTSRDLERNTCEGEKIILKIFFKIFCDISIFVIWPLSFL